MLHWDVVDCDIPHHTQLQFVVFLSCSSVFKTPCTPVGVADRNIIPNDEMTASSTHPDDLPHLGRVNETRHNGVWCTEQNRIDGDYLQADLGVVHSVCAVATQGPRNELWVKSFKLQFSTDGAIWNFYHENANEKVS